MYAKSKFCAHIHLCCIVIIERLLLLTVHLITLMADQIVARSEGRTGAPPHQEWTTARATGPPI